MKATHPPIPMSYKPKLDAVFAGDCCQTIRKGDKYAVGQCRWIFEWSGTPYRSKWGRRMLVEIRQLTCLILSDAGLMVGAWEADIGSAVSSRFADRLAAEDGIDPPTGVALRDTLKRLNGKDWQGEYQVVRWKPAERSEG